MLLERDENISRQLTELSNNIHKRTIRIKRLANSRTPISRLGPELLARVFVEATNDPISSLISLAAVRKDGAIERPAKYLTASFVSSVCSQWRTIAISEKYLWRNLFLTPFIPVGHVTLYTRRANGVSLRVAYFDDNTHCDLSNVVLRNSLFPSIVDCQYLVISIRSGRVLGKVLQGLSRISAPRLERLCVSYEPFKFHESEKHLFQTRNCRLFNHHAPKLSVLELSGVPLQCCCPPMDSLRCVIIERDRVFSESPGTDLHVLRGLLEVAENLEFLTLKFIAMTQDNTSPFTVQIKNRRLRRLCFTNVFSPPIMQLVAQIDMSSVTDLTGHGSGLSRIIELRSLTLNSEPSPLTSLSFLSLGGRNVLNPISRFLMLAQLSPSLEHLSLEGRYCIRIVLNYLIDNEERKSSAEKCTAGDILWPFLKSLTLKDLWDDQQVLLGSFLTLRASVGKPLARLRLHLQRYVRPSFVDEDFELKDKLIRCPETLKWLSSRVTDRVYLLHSILDDEY